MFPGVTVATLYRTLDSTACAATDTHDRQHDTWQQHDVCTALRRKAQCDTVGTITILPTYTLQVRPQAQVYERYHSNPTYLLLS